MNATVTNIKESPSSEGHRRWKNEFAQGVQGDATTFNRSGIGIKPLYTPADWSGQAYEPSLGYYNIIFCRYYCRYYCRSFPPPSSSLGICSKPGVRTHRDE